MHMQVLLAFAIPCWFSINEDLGSIAATFCISIGGFVCTFILLLLFLFVIAPFVLCNIIEQVVFQDPEDQVKPKEIDGLKTSKEREGDDLANPAFVLLSLPVQLERSHGPKLGQNGPDNFQIDVVS